MSVLPYSDKLASMANISQDNAFLHAALTATHAGVFEWHVQARTIELSPNLEALLGFPPGRFDGRIDSLLDILNPHDRDQVLASVKSAPPDQTLIETEVRINGTSGQTRWFAIRGELQRDTNNNPATVIGMAQEVPPVVVSERRMRAQQSALFDLLAEERIDTLPLDEAFQRITEKAAHTLDVERVSIWLFSDDMQTLQCHDLYLKSRADHIQCISLKASEYPRYFEALSKSRALAVSYAPTDHRTQELNEKYLKYLGISSMLEATIRRRGDTIGVVCHEQVGPSRSWTLDEQHFAASVADVVTLLLEGHEREELLKHIEYQAMHDRLTGLPNRLWFRKLLEDRIRQSSRPFALILADLDQFKEINDTLGHELGDQLLIELGQRLTGLLPIGSALARLGGDEFGLLIEDPGAPNRLADFAASLRQAFARPVVCRGVRLAVQASLGASLFPEHGADVSTLMRRADVALYHAKTNDRYRIYDPSRDRHTPRRLTLMHDLIRAVEQDDIQAVFQPKLDIRSNKVVGVEALARWKHPEFGAISPDEFIPLAELSDLIRPLTLHMIRTACMQKREWLKDGHDLHVAVNLSPRMLMEQGWSDELLSMLRAFDMPPGGLELEVTETAFIHDPERALGIMQELSGHGINFALDDFGVGFSSLTHLSRMPIHTLKIDKSFVQQMASDPRLNAIVHSTIQLGENLGLQVVAEGVENAGLLMRLREMRCHMAQGYHFSPAIEADRIPLYMNQAFTD
jgi:diguanylate cyclase (GGDEF)-like protein